MFSRFFGGKKRSEGGPGASGSRGRDGQPSGASQKDEIAEIRIEIEAGGENILSMMISRDGSIGRRGNGSLPVEPTSVLGVIDSGIFRELVDSLDDAVLSRAGVYDLPDKTGLPVTYRISFLDVDRKMLYGFGFLMGSEAKPGNALLSYFDGFIVKAVRLTDEWYLKAMAEKKHQS